MEGGSLETGTGRHATGMSTIIYYKSCHVGGARVMCRVALSGVSSWLTNVDGMKGLWYSSTVRLLSTQTRMAPVQIRLSLNLSCTCTCTCRWSMSIALDCTTCSSVIELCSPDSVLIAVPTSLALDPMH